MLRRWMEGLRVRWAKIGCRIFLNCNIYCRLEYLFRVRGLPARSWFKLVSRSLHVLCENIRLLFYGWTDGLTIQTTALKIVWKYKYYSSLLFFTPEFSLYSQTLLCRNPVVSFSFYCDPCSAHVFKHFFMKTHGHPQF